MGAVGKEVSYGAFAFLFVVLLLSADHVTEARRVLVEKPANNVLKNLQLGRAEVIVGHNMKDGGLDGGYGSQKYAGLTGGYDASEPATPARGGLAAEDTYIVSQPVDGLATQHKSITASEPVGALASNGLATEENYIGSEEAANVVLKNDRMEEWGEAEGAAVGDTMTTGAGTVIHGRGLTGHLDHLKDAYKKLKAKIVGAVHKKVKHADDQIHKAVKKHDAAFHKVVKHADDQNYKTVKKHGAAVHKEMKHADVIHKAVKKHGSASALGTVLVIKKD